MKNDTNALYELNGRISILKALPYGLQNILAMFMANISPVLIIAGVCGMGNKDS